MRSDAGAQGRSGAQVLRRSSADALARPGAQVMMRSGAARSCADALRHSGADALKRSGASGRWRAVARTLTAGRAQVHGKTTAKLYRWPARSLTDSLTRSALLDGLQQNCSDAVRKHAAQSPSGKPS